MLAIVNIKDYLLLVFFFFYAVLLPGYLLTRGLVTPGQLRKLLDALPSVEKNLLYRYFYYLFAPAVGLILVDAVVLLMAKLHWALSFNNLLVVFSIINIVLLILNIWFIRSPKSVETHCNASLQDKFVYTFILLFLASVLIRTVFYLPNAVPQDTDLGHHMYWSQWMVQKESFPVYDTPEVIEGEHMVFAVLSKLSGITLLSAMPLIALSFYNLTMLLALFFCSMAITANRRIALWTLFFSGIYFAIDPPQARYVKGGVIGNTFGNLFIPLVFLLLFLFIRYFYKYLNEKNRNSDVFKPAGSLIALILIIIAGSFYTHHLSTFLLGITLAASFFVWIFLTFGRDIACHVPTRDTIKILISFMSRMVTNLKLVLTFLAIVAFPLFIYIPHYLASNAVTTVTQEPEKETHLGITLGDFLGKMGWTRFVLLTAAVVCLVLVLLINIAKRYRFSEKISSLRFFERWVEKLRRGISLSMTYFLFFGWFLPLALLSFYPEVFKIDLPSRRVVNYLVFPGIILAAVAANLFFSRIVKKINRNHLKVAIIGLAAIVLWDGSADLRSAYTGQNKFQDAVELYHASNYLARHTPETALMLKDHSTIPGDSWMKFFLLRGYDYFISRTYNYKYTAAQSTLDPCSREMIIVPESSVAKGCYGQTGINYVIVKPAGDEFLFWKGQDFETIYLNDDIAIFKKN